VFGQLSQANIGGHIVEIGAIVLPHEKELT
jgi:hypothetical protein